MNVTLDNTIVLTERLLQLSGEAQRAEGSPVCAGGLVEVVQNCCFSRLTQARSKAIDLGYDGIQQPVLIDGDEVLLGSCAPTCLRARSSTPGRRHRHRVPAHRRGRR